MMVTTFMPATNKRTNLDCRYGIIVISPRGSVQQYHVYYICYSQNHEHTWTLTTYLQWRKYGVSTNNFAHAQTLSRMSSLSGRMNIARVNIGFFTGFKKIKQRRMILWKISTAISIKHRILAPFNKKINSDSL
jgi:hypothetical protein